MRDHFSVVACGACEACACTKLELDVVDEGAGRDLAERHAVTHLSAVRSRRRLERIADLHVLRREHVAALAISEDDAGDETGAVRIVLDGLDACRDVLLVVLEIDIAQAALVAAALVTYGDAAVVARLPRFFEASRLFIGLSPERSFLYSRVVMCDGSWLLACRFSY
jgi:hypothetical protein